MRVPFYNSSKALHITVVLVLVILGSLAVAVRKTEQAANMFSVVLPVPFTSQAPNNNWDRNEDCEETSITMANAYLTGTIEDKLPPAAALQAINTLKAWEQANIGYNANTGADATAQMAEGAFGLKVTQIWDYSETDLKNALAEKHPVLLPINARRLNNPAYADNGPLYHMIVVRGYEGNAFIVNDPGTNGGESNKYTFAVLKGAAADWNQATKSMDANRKIALVLSK